MPSHWKNCIIFHPEPMTYNKQSFWLANLDLYPKLSIIMTWFWRTTLFDLCFRKCSCNSWFSSVQFSKPLLITLHATDTESSKEESPFFFQQNIYTERKWNLECQCVTRSLYKVYDEIMKGVIFSGLEKLDDIRNQEQRNLWNPQISEN